MRTMTVSLAGLLFISALPFEACADDDTQNFQAARDAEKAANECSNAALSPLPPRK